MSFLIAGEDKTFIYALGPGGTNTFFCQVQSAGPERISKAEKEAVAALMADAPALLEALSELLNSEWQDDDGHPRLEAARDKARALIAKHRGEL